MARPLAPRVLVRTEDQVLRNLAGTTISAASVALGIVAIMLNSTTLFYMATAMIVLLLACRLQAWLSVRWLRIERVAPANAQVGDVVTVQMTVWSEKKVRRPLVNITDALPKRLYLSELSPSLPIAPAFDLPIHTQYQFRAIKRGKYRWSGVEVAGTDALGIVTKMKTYATELAEITILPMPLPVVLDLPNASGWGISEAVSGQSRGAGMEPRGVREYISGDSLRYVHWRSSARANQLLVKEFEAGSNAAAAFLLQRTSGTDIGVGARTTLEAMCSHAAFLSDAFMRQGARVEFPVLEDIGRTLNARERMAEIMDLLAGVNADSAATLGDDAMECLGKLPPGSTIFVMVSIADRSLVSAVNLLHGKGCQVVPLLYDAAQFAPKGHRPRGETAVSPSYIDELRSAGAFPLVIPPEAYPR